MRHRLNLLDLENPQICLPAMEFEQWIVIGADRFRSDAGPGQDATEHAANSVAIQRSSIDGNAYNLARVLIHDDHYPVRFKDQRLASEEIQRPQAVLGMSEKCQPG